MGSGIRRLGALIGLVAVVALCVAGLARASRGTANAVLPQNTAHGANFLIESQIDNSYCIQVDGGTGEGRGLTLQQCGTTDTQRFTLTWRADGLTNLIDSQGMCIGVTDRTQPPLTAFCADTSAFRLTVPPSGQFHFQRTNWCLSVPGASANAAVTLAKCSDTAKGQQWKIAH